MESNYEATYCPEDNKLRLYCGRVPREEYLALKAQGWTSTPKQSCDFVATWTPNRETTALKYGGGFIGDEDQDPGSRAAERAQRFMGYQSKRIAEATGFADSYEDGPSVHGYQDPKRAERAAAKHDRVGTKAVNQWEKAEYWQQRTAGVIQNALYKDLPGVRMGRIKTLEAELRKLQASWEEYRKEFGLWEKVLTIEDSEQARKLALCMANHSYGYDYKHPRPELVQNSHIRETGSSLYTLLTLEEAPITGHEAAQLWLANRVHPDNENSRNKRWQRHYELRLAYENQMLAEQGGRLEQRDVEVGGLLFGHIITKVSKSQATKRATSCSVVRQATRTGKEWDDRCFFPGTNWRESRYSLERVDPGAYTPPTPETLAKLKEIKAEIKAADTTPKGPQLVNLTMEDARRLQDLWNRNAKAASSYPEHVEDQAVRCLTQAEYSERSKGTYAHCRAYEITEGGEIFWKNYAGKTNGTPAFKLRVSHGAGQYSGNAKRVIVITDKPQKPLPIQLPTEEVAA